MKPSDFLTELSTEKLAKYKTAAAADASKADKEGDFKRGDKRFSGIVKATKKQFANDTKQDVAEMDSQSPKGRMKSDGTRSHSTYGSRDHYSDSDPQHTATPTTAKKTIKQATDIFNKAFKDVDKKKGVAEGWSQKYKSSINCSHPKGFSQKAHCAGKKKHNESIEMEMTCPDCGMCETHINQENLDEACWKGYHKEGNKKMFGKTYPNCVKNEDIAENDLDKYKKYIRPVVKTEPKIERTTNPAGRTTDHVEYKVTSPTGEIHRYKSKKQAQEHFDSFKQQGVAEGSTETTQQQQVRAAISKGLEVHKQKGDAEYKTRLDRSNKVGTVPGHYFDNTGYASDKLTGIDSIDPDGTVVTSLNDTDAEGWVKKLATLGGMPGVKTRALQSPTTSSRSLAEESCPHCGGEMVSEELMNEKKDACYYKVKSRYSVWPSAYASGALVKCRNKGASNWGNGGKKNESSILEGIESVDESLHDWFSKEKWVRMDTKGNIKGPCAREPGEGKPKCLPQSKAHSLGKKGRASAAARKRREDPNPDRSGKAINVNTKKKD